jgi:hypothetical protein
LAEHLAGNRTLEDVGVDGRITLKWIFKGIGREAADSINLARDKNKWLFYMHTNMGGKKLARKFKSGGLHERHVVADCSHRAYCTAVYRE